MSTNSLACKFFPRSHFPFNPCSMIRTYQSTTINKLYSISCHRIALRVCKYSTSYKSKASAASSTESPFPGRRAADACEPPCSSAAGYQITTKCWNATGDLVVAYKVAICQADGNDGWDSIIVDRTRATCN